MRRKHKSREEAGEDESLVKRIMIERGDIKEGVNGINRLATKGEQYTLITQHRFGFRAVPNRGWTGIVFRVFGIFLYNSLWLRE